ncbi:MULTISPECIES: hypothetical protein [Paenibacillus]|uniref:Uncharacterized protein n=1 Tax=Paenibacillus radicis (ex Xue et al. 2023) TaxID=2972489 RepID=A0ABT1YF76_9BACL|nr:hypothetical protein [Paenibacillus radicis (ex Xue et al. 2023)]MCR8631821.1 hypothetical protein [Paenibacillus radicis (ex Xue et al. 2023)]
MIQYGSEHNADLKFLQLQASIEVRDSQWVDVELSFELSEDSLMPTDLTDLTALLVCTRSGEIFQIVPQDEGRDCEYQFTEAEKVQLRQFYEAQVKSRLLQAVKAEVQV